MATRPATQAPLVRIVAIRPRRRGGAGGHHGGAWKVAYADFVTAMMAFFMLLWLLADPDKQRLKGLAQYFSPSTASSKPGETIDSVTGSTAGLAGQREQAKAERQQRDARPASAKQTDQSARGARASIPDSSLRVLAEELKLLLQPMASQGVEKQAVAMDIDREGLRINLMDDAHHAMFLPGTASFYPAARLRMLSVATRIARGGAPLAIEGHTDMSGGNGVANWKLSAERALAARAVLIEGGVTPDRFTEIVALGPSRPVFHEAPERPENRRITIVVLAEAPALPDDIRPGGE